MYEYLDDRSVRVIRFRCDLILKANNIGLHKIPFKRCRLFDDWSDYVRSHDRIRIDMFNPNEERYDLELSY